MVYDMGDSDSSGHGGSVPTLGNVLIFEGLLGL